MLSYVNNKFCSLEKAQISVNDRGYQFGDAVYEVIYYKNGKFLDLEGHLKRLRTSMSRIDFELKYSDLSRSKYSLFIFFIFRFTTLFTLDFLLKYFGSKYGI